VTLKAFLTEYCDHKANTLKPSSLAALRHYLLGRDEPGKCRNLRSRGMIKSYLAPCTTSRPPSSPGPTPRGDREVRGEQRQALRGSCVPTSPQPWLGPP